MTYYSDISVQSRQVSANNYGRVMAWIAASFFSFLAAASLIGPHVPTKYALPLSILVIVILIAASFARKLLVNPVFSGILAIIIPALMGIVIYPTIEALASAGKGDIIVLSGAGTAIIFTTVALWGWFSKKSLENWSSKLFFILLGVIAISLLNVAFFHLTGLSLIISLVTLIIFTIYVFIDIQRIRNRTINDNVPDSYYALNIFLDIINIFMSLLNIGNILSD